MCRKGQHTISISFLTLSITLTGTPAGFSQPLEVSTRHASRIFDGRAAPLLWPVQRRAIIRPARPVFPSGRCKSGAASPAAREAEPLRVCTAAVYRTVSGTFLDDPGDVPPNAQQYVAHQLGLAEPPTLTAYRTERTQWRHVEDIRHRCGFVSLRTPSYFRLVRWLYSRAWLSAERPSLLFDLATARLVERKVLLPGVTVLERLVGRVQDRTARRLWRLLAPPPPLQRVSLDSLVIVPADSRESPLDRLRHGSYRVSAPSLVNALHRLQGDPGARRGRYWTGAVSAQSHHSTFARYAAKTPAAMPPRL